MNEKKCKTIRKILSEYTWFLMGVTFLVLVVFWGFYMFSNCCYQKNTDHVLTLNSFYNDLDSSSQVLNQYINSGTYTDYEKLCQIINRLTANMKRLQNIQVSESFQRDMKDLGCQLEEYRKILDTLHGHIIEQGKKVSLDSSVWEKIEEDSEESNRMYQLMNAQYKEIYLRLFYSMNKKQQELNTGLTVICIFLFAGIFVLMYWIMKHARIMTGHIADPLQTLTTAAEKIRDGELESFEKVQIQTAFYEEVQTLIGVFNMMVMQLRKQINVIKEKARAEAALHEKELENMRIITLLKTSEFKALQMQMNPHFLFNTLNMIARTADFGDTDKTSLLLQKTAQLLRYNLDYSGKTVSLANEIEMLGNYVYLQEQRFSSKIFFDFDLDERFHNISIPCFILQPLVENAIVHGINKKIIEQNPDNEYIPPEERGTVIIRTSYDTKKHQGEISIIDNGAGMTEDERQKILARLDSDSDQREKIGLANVHIRLKLVFGERYHLVIKSEKEKGTQISVVLERV